MRFTTILFTFIAASSISLAACGGGGDDDGSADDDVAVEPDAGTTTMPDANPPASKTLGQSCTPDQADPMGAGDCGAGLTCLALTGTTGPFCTKTCTGTQDTSCDAMLPGAGVGLCLLGVDFTGDMMSDATFCIAVCQANDAAACPDCNNMCPDNYLMCTEPLNDAQGQPVAHACI